MATDEQGRQLSDDGYYYWDGAAWQPVQQGSGSGGSAGNGSASPQEAFAAALAQAGIQVDASAVPDLATVESGLAAAWQWYHSLDSTTMSAIDAATAGTGEASIALAQAGVATGIEGLLNAFDQASGSLGELLTTAYQAFHAASPAS